MNSVILLNKLELFQNFLTFLKVPFSFKVEGKVTFKVKKNNECKKKIENIHINSEKSINLFKMIK